MARKTERRRLWERRRNKTRSQLERSERPLLTCYRSGKHIYAQIVDPFSGRTLAAVSSRTPGITTGCGKNVESAKKVGAAIAKRALDLDIKAVALNRNGFVFAGRLRALADAAREAGLQV